MGLFDEIRCEYPPPESGYRLPPGHTFKTKSLGGALDNYTITADGRLILHKVRGEGVPEEERPYYGTPEWEDNPRHRLLGSIRKVPVGDEEIPYHGDIYFYNSFAVRDEPGLVWIEYKARFTEGRLSRVEIADVHDLQYKNVASSGEPVVERSSDASGEG